ncbi:TPA: hypothetical protein ACXYLO_003554 [Legionella anisa]
MPNDTPKVRGPKDGKIVTASFDPISKKDNGKSRFPSLVPTHDLVLLSIKGNEYCAGDYLGAIVQQAVATHQPPDDYSGPKGKTTFLIADEIYWHNLKDKTLPPDERDILTLKKSALEEGELYFENNLGAFLAPLGMTVDVFKSKYPDKSMDEKISIINQLALEQGKNFEIVRWHTWITQRDFDKTLKEILPYYDEVEGLRVAVDESVSDFVKRHCKVGDDPGVWTERSRGYLKEESPSIMLLAAYLGYNFIIYPGGILPPFEATKEYFIVDKHTARIEKGESVKSECTHNKFCLHSENPSRLVNWLKVNFVRSHGNTKTQETTKTKEGANPSSGGVIEHQEVIKPQEVTTSDITRPEVTKLRAIKFFDQSKPSVSPRKGLGNPKTDGVDTDIIDVKEDGIVLELVPKKETIISSIVQGVTQALESHFPPQKSGKLEKRTPTPLTQIFEGITQGVLSSNQISMQDKVSFLTELIDTYMMNHSEEPRHVPVRMPMIS